MLSPVEMEHRVRRVLAAQREEEGGRRRGLEGQIVQAQKSGELPGDYPYKSVKEILRTPLDWQIDIFGGGIRFKRDFPYETEVYGMRGWDAARMVVDLRAAHTAVALRVHFLDQQADANIDEGVLVSNRQVISFAQHMGIFSIYSFVLRDIQNQQKATKGEFGCTLDHLKDELDKLPSMVKDLSGSSYGRFLADFLQRVESGEIDTETMPRLALGWPLLSPPIDPRRALGLA